MENVFIVVVSGVNIFHGRKKPDDFPRSKLAFLKDKIGL